MNQTNLNERNNMNYNEEVFESNINLEDVQNDAIMEHPNGTLWAVYGYPDLDYYNIYQYDEKKGIYPYNPFFLDDNPKVEIKKKGHECKVGMTREDLFNSLVHEHFKLKT
jgi:hypothetical protein